MPNLYDLNLQKNIKLLVYGDSGSGKTVFSCSFPGPIYVADFDGKISSAAAYYKGTETLKGIEYDSYLPDPEKSNDQPYARFYTKILEFESQVKKKTFKYQTIVIDSLTFMVDQMLDEIMKQNPGVKRWDTGKLVPVLQDYGILKVKFKEQIARILALPCHIVVTAHISTSKDETTGEILRKPLMAGGSADILPMLFAEVYRAFVVKKDGKSTHMLQTRSDGKFICRTQITKIPEFVDTNFGEIIKWI